MREHFSLFKHHPGLVYFDNAATAPKPYPVVQAVNDYYETCSSNIHRSVHKLAEVATMRFEATREKVAKFLKATSTEEIVFTSGTTFAVNLIARNFIAPRLQAGDEILLSPHEHHANLVPWLMLKKEKGIHLKFIDVHEDWSLKEPEFSDKTKFVAIVHVSNSLGLINPVEKICRAAKARNIPVLIDGAQAVSHLPVSVKEIGCDFYVFSAHKLYGPTGLGVLWGKKQHLDAMDPLIGGGDMIKTVSYEDVSFAETPAKFEAGTPPIASVWGLGAALDWLATIGWETIRKREEELLGYGLNALKQVKDLTLTTVRASDRAPTFSFVMKNAHAHDLGTLLSADDIAVRSGHHCTQPLMNRMGFEATTRASLAFYNSTSEIDRLIESLRKAQRLLA